MMDNCRGSSIPLLHIIYSVSWASYIYVYSCDSKVYVVKKSIYYIFDKNGHSQHEPGSLL